MYLKTMSEITMTITRPTTLATTAIAITVESLVDLAASEDPAALVTVEEGPCTGPAVGVEKTCRLMEVIFPSKEAPEKEAKEPKTAIRRPFETAAERFARSSMKSSVALLCTDGKEDTVTVVKMCEMTVGEASNALSW
jgi:hypothetical protein